MLKNFFQHMCFGFPRIQRSAGFTLIELMIVVGIIGILVAIAAPNFSRYQSKARQSEAKIALAAVYSAEKSFYTEYNAYAGAMDAIGYSPEGFKRFYEVGWSIAHSGTISGFAGALSTASWPSVNNPYTSCANSTLAAGLAGDAQTFTVTASGCIRQGATAEDVWNMTDVRRLSNTTVSL